MALQYTQTKFRILSAISKRKAAARVFKLFTTPRQRVIRPLTPLFLEAEALTTHFDGIPVRGYRWNHPSDKKILILHGYESTILNFESYVKPLIGKGYEVLGFDAPAHGRSGGKTINALIYKAFIRHIHHTYGPVTHFIAHSLGGLGLSLFLETEPLGEGGKVVLIAPAVETTTAIDHYFRILKLPPDLRPVLDEYITGIEGLPPEWFSLRRAAAHIRAQVLFLQDKDDALTPYRDVVPIIKARYPNFRFIISEGLGHSQIYRDKASVAAVMDFL